MPESPVPQHSPRDPPGLARLDRPGLGLDLGAGPTPRVAIQDKALPDPRLGSDP